MRKSTEELLEILKSSKSIEGFLESNMDEIPSYSLSEYLNRLIEEKGLKKNDIIKAASIERSYFYQILKGSKFPSRNKIIMLAIAMELDYNECQNVLRIAKTGPLYVKDLRDSVIIYCLLNGKSIVDMNIYLYDLNLEIVE